MAQAAHAEHLSGVCVIGAVGRGNYQMFVLLRDLVVIVAAVVILASGCLSSSLPSNEGFATSSGIGRKFAKNILVSSLRKARSLNLVFIFYPMFDE
jgi:hypothetical protein